MKINGIDGAKVPGGNMGMVQATDSVSKSIQNQIANAQKQLQELSSNEEMSVEEKMKKRQEIQKQITDLNNQLRQHQLEQRKEKQQVKDTSSEDKLGGTRKTTTKSGSQGTGLSQASMQAIISADSAMSQAQIQGSVATKMEGRAGVLKAEIKQDAGRGNVEAKQEELAEMEQKAMNATASQMNTLAEANKDMEEATKADQTAEKTEKKPEEKRTDEEKQVQTAGGKTENVTGVSERNTNNVETSNSESEVNVGVENVTAKVQQVVNYTPADVRI